MTKPSRKTPRPQWLVAGSPYVVVFFGSIAISLILSIAFRALDGSIHLNLWIAFNLVIEGFAGLALYTFQKTPRRVFETQILLGSLIRTINLVKVHYLNLPVIPSDFFLFDELMKIVPHYATILVSVGIVIVVTFVSIRTFHSLKRPRRWQWFGAFPLTAVIIWLFAFPSSYAATFDALLKNELLGIPFLLKERSQTMGLLFSFSLDWAKYLEIKYEKPSRSQVESVLTKMPSISSSEPAKLIKPNVYIILAESFWDPSEMLSSPKSLLDARFDKLWNQNGRRHFLSPTYGGGTANVEFEALCGIPSRSTGRGIVFQVALSNSLECLPKILKNFGYKTFAFHPFDGSFYNRTAAFPKIGFEHFSSIKDYLPEAQPGDFIGDREFIFSSIEAARKNANGKPFLAYMMTFAGHWPYQWLPSYEYEYDKKLEFPGKADSANWETVERYLNVNRISSKVIANAIDEISMHDPSALIVVAGDHLPNLASNLLLGTTGDDLKDWRFFRTPLLIIDPNELRVLRPEPEMPAYMVPHEILARIGIPPSSRAHMNLFEPPPTLIVRGVQNGATFVEKDSEAAKSFQFCVPQLNTTACKEAIDWLRLIRPIALDLVLGSQYTYDSIRRPASDH